MIECFSIDTLNAVTRVVELHSELSKNFPKYSLERKNDFKCKNSKKFVLETLNINSIIISNEFESVEEIIQNLYDIFLICETKIDLFIPTQHLSSLNIQNFERIVIHTERINFRHKSRPQHQKISRIFNASRSLDFRLKSECFQS